jgi:hypothetical protein
MTIRTSKAPVTFRLPFSLSSIDGSRPAGTYLVETDEERIELLSRTAYRRVSTTMILPLADGGASYQRVQVNPAELEVALQRDSDQSHASQQ